MAIYRPSWIATAGTIGGVEVCIGLAARFDMDYLLETITPPRLQAYKGAAARVVRADDPWPVFYVAVRYPQVVEMRLQGPTRVENELRHVRVTFDTGLREGPPAVPAPRRPVSTVGFIITLDLPIEQESAFYRAMIGDHKDADWRGVYRRLLQMAQGELRWDEAHPVITGAPSLRAKAS
jgi:hypothetical protein